MRKSSYITIIKRPKQLALSFILFLNSINVNGQNLDTQNTAEESNRSGIEIIHDPETKATISTQIIESATPHDVEEILKSVSGKDVIVSTDSPDVLKITQDHLENSREQKEVTLVPFGELTPENDPKWSISKSLTNSKKYLSDTIRKDKIGLVITAVVTGVDSYFWIHSQKLGVDQKTLMVLFNLILAGTFGLNKDLWSKISGKIQMSTLSVLKKIGLANQEGIKTFKAQLASKYAAGFVIASSIQMTRMSIISLDQLYHSLGSASFWGTTALLGTLITFSTAGWSEQIREIDQTKNPTTKFIAQRLSEIRSIVLGFTSSSAKIIQVDAYGITPILYLVANGLIGFLAYIRTENITHRVENSRFSNWLQSSQKSKSGVLQHAFWSLFNDQPIYRRLIRCESIL